MFLQPRLLVHNPALSQERNEGDADVAHTSLKQVLRPAKIWGQTVNVVPRETCSFRRIDLNGRGQSALQAAHFKAEREALLHEDSFKISPDPTGTRAGLWGFENPTTGRARCLPETLARESLVTGCRIVNAITGFEGQVWQDNVLIGSRWWRQVPTLQKWVGFLRACAGETEFEFNLNAVPAPEDVPFRNNIPPVEFDRDRLSVLFSPINIIGIAGVLLACATVFLSAQYIRSAVQLKMVQSEIAKTSDATNTILSQRRRALGNMSAVTRYHKLGHEGEIMLGLDALARVLNNKGLRIFMLDYSNRTLKVQFNGTSKLPMSQLVTELESSDIFENVSIDSPAPDKVIVTAQVKDLFAAPKPAAPRPQKNEGQ